MRRGLKGQYISTAAPGVAGAAPVSLELIVPNPKLKLLDQVREVMRLRHYSIRTEQCYCDWIRRYVKFHGMRSREDLSCGTGKVESFLSDLAVKGNVPVNHELKVESWPDASEGAEGAWDFNAKARRRKGCRAGNRKRHRQKDGGKKMLNGG